jgi:hypothetical protein
VLTPIPFPQAGCAQHGWAGFGAQGHAPTAKQTDARELVAIETFPERCEWTLEQVTDQGFLPEAAESP